MSDFCLSPQAMARIARQTGLMEGMASRAGVYASSMDRSADPALWYEARLKCIGCAMSEPCMRFLASPRPAGQTQVASFCANRAFFGDLGQRVQQLAVGRSK